MKHYRSTVSAAALALGGLLLWAHVQQWTRAWWRCEAFGCIGLGLIYLAGAALAVLVFTIAGAVLGPRPKAASALFAALAALVSMLGVFAAMFVLNQVQIERDTRAAQAACLAHPQLCPSAAAGGAAGAGGSGAGGAGAGGVDKDAAGVAGAASRAGR